MKDILKDEEFKIDESISIENMDDSPSKFLRIIKEY